MTSQERREARYQRRQARRRRNRQARSDGLGGLTGVFSYRNMFKYGKKVLQRRALERIYT